ncbi:SDR family oxidoreductase [Austwickia sp. TVS 96-490-7B]|uniref:SDR family oxidoreductase n=1 Tax=Austwickia sp. TVS 96-490-7B TaxID=2830843 RepID=UPI0021024693|nr:SDR family oxidoreductase [Austwickia sp. TVS 96-490-7B]
MSDPVSKRMREAQVTVVTGASRGIGAFLAAAFLEAGHVVVGTSRSGGTVRLPGGSELSLSAVEVTDDAAVSVFVEGVMDAYGRIDVLVNNAGVIDAEVPFLESDPLEWWRTVEVDVRGPYVMTRRVMPYMVAAGSGRIINLNSGAGTRAADRASAYFVAKTALSRVTGAAHAAGFDRGVRAFDLMPGVVRTDMTLSMPSHAGRTEWTSPQDVTDLAVALAAGQLDAWSGRFVRAGVDSVSSLSAAAGQLQDRARQLVLMPYGVDDPLG